LHPRYFWQKTQKMNKGYFLRISTTNQHEPTRTGRRLRSKSSRGSWLIIFFLLSSCSRQTSQDGILIALSITPQSWFVSQIAGDKAAVITLISTGQNQHTFEPSPRQIQSLALADAWILSGSEFEIGLRPKIETLFPKMLIVDGIQGVQFRLLENNHHDDQHSPSRELDSSSSIEIDRHTWLGREGAKVLASHIKNTLCALDNKNEAYYSGRYDSLIAVIDEEFDKLKISLAPLKGRSVFVYHPSFGYFLDEFGIKQEAVESGGKEPSPRELNNLITKIKEENAAAIFVQTQFPSGAVKTLASSAGLEVVSLDPFSYDWLENIKLIALALERSIR
jgi:zinc transport system substrate-binding protein